MSQSLSFLLSKMDTYPSGAVVKTEQMNPHKVFRKCPVHKKCSSGSWRYLLNPFKAKRPRISVCIRLSVYWETMINSGMSHFLKLGANGVVACSNNSCSTHWQHSFPFLSVSAIKWAHRSLAYDSGVEGALCPRVDSTCVVGGLHLSAGQAVGRR